MDMATVSTSRNSALRVGPALLLAFLLATPGASAQWINELHYDNEGADTGEAVEVVLPAAADPNDFDVFFYNGTSSSGASYGSANVGADGTAGVTEGGFTFHSVPFKGIQNGSPDGLALAEGGALVPGQFLSYEGSFTAVGGPADGETSTDIGVEEESDTPEGQSLQLTGSGTSYGSFMWTGPSDASFGALNAGQTLTSGGGARVQVVHNAPDPDLAVVDVAFDLILTPQDGASRGGLTPQGGAAARGGDPALAFDDVAFREATPYTGLTAGPYQIRVTLPDDPDAIVIDSLVTVDIGDTLQVVIIGVVVGAPGGGGDPTAELILNDDAREESEDPLLFTLNAAHGTPDAPTIDLRRAQSTFVLFDDLEYGESTDYIEIQPVDGFIEVTSADGDEVLATVRGDFRGLGGEAATVLASGFLTPGDEPPGAPDFALLFAFADGGTRVVFPITVSNEGGPTPAAFAVEAPHPNPSAAHATLRYDLPAAADVRLELYDVLGRRVLAVPARPVAVGAGLSLRFETGGLAAGTYLWRLAAEAETEAFHESGRITVIR